MNQIRPLDLGELPSCLALAADRGWPPEEHKWRLLFEVGTVYGMHDDDGTLVGTATLTTYGGSLAAISMVLVASSHGRRGIGGRLVAHLLDVAAPATVFLNATEYGLPVYERLGFVTVGTTYTYVGTLDDGTRSSVSRPAEPGDLPSIVALDEHVNGADRSHLVERLPDFTERLNVVEREGVVTGYGGTWRNGDYTLVAPILAETEHDARALVTELAHGVTSPLRLDLDERHPQLRLWTERHGLALRNTTAVMVLDGKDLPGDRSRWFVPLMQALG